MYHDIVSLFRPEICFKSLFTVNDANVDKLSRILLNVSILFND